MHGAGRSKSHAFHHSDPFLVLCFRSLIFCFDFLFQLRLTCALTQDAPDCSSRQSMELSTCEGGSARSRSRSPEATSHQPPTTLAVVVAGSDEMAMTPIMDSQLDANCSACSTASRWTPHTCKKARGANKRHATPAGVVLRTKRSSVSAALVFRAPHHAGTSVDVDSLLVTRSSMTKSSMNDTSVRIVEGDVFSGASSSHRLAVRLRHSRSNTSTECPAERL